MIGYLFLVPQKINQIPITVTVHKAEAKQITHKVVTEKKKIIKSNNIVALTEETKARIEGIFGNKATIAIAVLKHESGLRLDAQNWNCHYYKIVDGKQVRYSTSCKTIEDRSSAWSVDCGIGQINVKGKICPTVLLTFDGSMREVQKKYIAQGLNAWYSYTSGAYKQFL